MELEEKVMDLIRSNIEKKYVVTLQSNLRQDLAVDSFGTMMIINAIEDAFNIVVIEDDIRTLITVNDIVALLKTKYLSRETA